MKKRILFVMVSILILSLVFVGCSKDKEVDEPTTTEKVSTTEPTTKFEAPEIKDEPTTEETTEETEASAPETTKKPTYSYNSGSSNSGSSNSGSNSKPSSKPASTTKAPATTKASASNGDWVSTGKDENGNDTFTNGSGLTIIVGGDGKGGESSVDDFVQDGEGTGADSME